MITMPKQNMYVELGENYSPLLAQSGSLPIANFCRQSMNN